MPRTKTYAVSDVLPAADVNDILQLPVPVAGDPQFKVYRSSDTSPIPLVFASNWSLESYVFVQIGPLLWGMIAVKYTGTTTLSPDSGGNLADTTICTFPAPFQPAWVESFYAVENGVKSFGVRLSNAGTLALTNGFSGQTCTTNTVISVPIKVVLTLS